MKHLEDLTEEQIEALVTEVCNSIVGAGVTCPGCIIRFHMCAIQAISAQINEKEELH
jgi:hypothetical protein